MRKITFSDFHIVKYRESLVAKREYEAKEAEDKQNSNFSSNSNFGRSNSNLSSNSNPTE